MEPLLWLQNHKSIGFQIQMLMVRAYPKFCSAPEVLQLFCSFALLPKGVPSQVGNFITEVEKAINALISESSDKASNVDIVRTQPGDVT